MGFIDRIKERQKREREARRAKEREERRLEELREKKLEEAREVERDLERRDEAIRLERELLESELKAKERAARYKSRYLAERRAQRSLSQRALEYRQSRRETMRVIAHSEERDAEFKEKFRQSQCDAWQAEKDEASQIQRHKVRSIEARREEARLAKMQGAAKENQQGEARKSREAEAHRDEAHQADRRENLRQSRLKENREATAVEVDKAGQSEKLRDRREEERRENARLKNRRTRAEARLRREKDEGRREAKRRSIEAKTQASPAAAPKSLRIPGGRLSGSLPWLKVQGRNLVDEMDRPVTLRGISVCGLKVARPEGGSFHRLLDDMDLAALMDWGVTAVKVPIVQDIALDGSDEAEGEDYLEAVDETIQVAAQAGIYTVLQLSALSSLDQDRDGTDDCTTDSAMPDQGSIDLWAILAHRYSEEPAVIFDLFPAPEGSKIDALLLGMSQLFWPVWMHWMLSMIGEIRRGHPRSLIVVRGPTGDFSGFPLTYSDGSQVNNIIYATEASRQNAQKAQAEVMALVQNGCPALLEISAGLYDESYVQAIGRVLARAGIHWVSTTWKDGLSPIVSKSHGRLEPTSLGRAFQSVFKEPPAPETNFQLDVCRLTFKRIIKK